MNGEETHGRTKSHGQTLPCTRDITLGSGGQALGSHIRSDTGSRRDGQGRVGTLEELQEVNEVFDICAGLSKQPSFANFSIIVANNVVVLEVSLSNAFKIVSGNGFLVTSDQSVTEHTNDTGNVTHEQDPVDTAVLEEFLGEEVESDFREDTDEDGLGDNTLVEVEFVSNVGRLVGGNDSTNQTSNQDSQQEESKAGVKEQSGSRGLGTSRRSFLGSTTVMAMVTVGVSFNLQVLGNTEVDQTNEHDGSDNQDDEHEIVDVFFTQEIFDEGSVFQHVNNFTDNAVANSTPQALTTEHFFAEAGIGGELAHDHAIKQGESTGSEEEGQAVDDEVLNEDQETVIVVFEKGEHQHARAGAVSGNAEGDNATVSTGAVSQARKDVGTEDVGELDEVGQGIVTVRNTPDSLDELVEEGVGGVNDDVQTKVEQLGENEILVAQASDSALVDRSGSGDGRFRGVGSLFDSSVGLFSRHAK